MKSSTKKLFIIPLAVAVLASCGPNNENASSSSNPNDPSTSQNSSDPVTPTPSSSDSSDPEESSSNDPAESSSDSSAPEVIHVSSVSLDKKTHSVHIGDEFTLVATVLPENADDKSVTWESSNTDVATVVEGKVTALKAGTANITVKTVDGEKTDVCALAVAEDVFTFAIQTEDGEKSSVEKSLNFDEHSTDTITLAITKNGAAYRGAEVETSFEGDAEVVESVAQSDTYDGQIDVAFSGKVGAVTLKMKLKGVESAPVLSVSYNITEYFLNQTIRRASISEADGKITFAGGQGQQYTAVVKKADTKWVLKAKMDIPEYAANYASVGVGSFLDAGDHAAWFSIRNTDSTADNKSEVYLRDFFNGWGSPVQDAAQYDAYKSVAFEENEAGTDMVIDMTLIRDGLNYYYDIGGYHGIYTSTYEDASYAGFFSQEQAAIITNYSIAYGDAAVSEAKGDTYGDAAKLDAASFVNANTSEIVRGETRTFQYISAPSYSSESCHLVADATYAEHVTIDGMKITIKDTAPAGEMTLTMESASGKKLGSISLPVVEVTSERENDQLVAKGGVILNDDGSFVFPEANSDVDGVVDESKYTDNAGYTVNLKQKVMGGDFTMEFDVEDYKATQNYPKLMISLGGAYSQFYLSLGRESGTVDRFETFTHSKQYLNPTAGQWNNTVDFKTVNPSFDRTAKHHYKIESKNGFYNFYVDDMENALAQKMDNDDRNITVPFESYNKALPVRIATRGVSAKVSNLQVTSGTDFTDKVYATRNVTAAEGSVTATFPTFSGDVWGEARYGSNCTAFASSLFATTKNAYKASFDAEFSSKMTDGKLIMTLGTHEYHIVNSTGGSKLQQAITYGIWGKDYNGIQFTGDDKPSIHVVVTNDGNGNVTMTVPGNSGDVVLTDNGVDTNAAIAFLLFNSTADDEGKTVTIKNVAFEDFAA